MPPRYGHTVSWRKPENISPWHNITVCPQDKPWINHDIKKTIRTRNAMYRRYQRTTQRHTTELKQKQTWKQQRRIMNKLIHKLGEIRKSPKTFWTVAKQVYGSKVKSSIPTLIDGNQHINTSKEKTEHTSRILRCTITSASTATESWSPRDNKATRSPEISRQQVQKLTPQLLFFYIYWI